MISFSAFSNELVKIAKARWIRELEKNPGLRGRMAQGGLGWKKWVDRTAYSGRAPGAVRRTAAQIRGATPAKKAEIFNAEKMTRKEWLQQQHAGNPYGRGAKKEQQRAMAALPLGTRARKPIKSRYGTEIPPERIHREMGYDKPYTHGGEN